MTYKNKKRQIKELTGFGQEMIKDSKMKLIFITVILIISFLTGIIIAAKTHSSYEHFENFGIVDIRTGGLTTTFFTRLMSMLLIALILFGCSFTIYTLPIALIFLAYRSYLLGLNICLMVVIYGLPGVIVTLIVALPCQLLALVALTLFYILMFKTNKDFKSFGGCKVKNQKMKLILVVIIILFAICIVESILLTLFSAKVILVI